MDANRTHAAQAQAAEHSRRQQPELGEDLDEQMLHGAEAHVLANGGAPAEAPDRALLRRRVGAIQRWAGNRAAVRLVGHVQRQDHAIVQRALLPAMGGQPDYEDGLDLDTVVTTALDKPPRPVMSGTSWSGKANQKARQALKAVFGTDDQSKWDLNSPLLLQVDEVHGNQQYDNKSGDLPTGPSYKEYDVAKYKGDPKGRGGKRIVIGDAAGVKTYYYTSNHYTDFAPFTPPSSTPAPTPTTTGTGTPALTGTTT